MCIFFFFFVMGDFLEQIFFYKSSLASSAKRATLIEMNIPCTFA